MHDPQQEITLMRILLLYLYEEKKFTINLMEPERTMRFRIKHEWSIHIQN